LPRSPVGDGLATMIGVSSRPWCGGAVRGLGVQPRRPVVEDRSIRCLVRSAADGHRSRVAEHRQHNQPRASACLRWKGAPTVHGIGRSRGGQTTKVHLVVEALAFRSPLR